MKTTQVLSAALAALSLCATTHAEGDRAGRRNGALAVTLVPIGFPLGLGADVSYRLSDRFSLRAGGGLPATAEAKSIEYGDVKYDVDVKFGGANAFLDWYPFAGSFHLSGGVTTVRDGWTLEAASTSSYTINGKSYPASGVGRLRGQTEVSHSVAPALLLGWGNPARAGRRWGVVFEVGLMYAGEDQLSLAADGPLGTDPAFARDLERESELHSSDHSFWPLLKVGVSYRF